MVGDSHHERDYRYWFPAKRYGWGWGPPITWQGWVVLCIWILATAVAAVRLMPRHLVGFLSVTGLMVLLLLTICYWKGEPPRWRWGDDD